MSAQVWKTLGIRKTCDNAAIRRAYAEKLKALDVDRDVAAFARLRQARDTALRLAAASAAPVVVPEPQAEDALHPADGSDLGLLADDELAPDQSPDGPEPVAASEAPDPDQRVPDMLRALAAIVFPKGDYSDEGFSLPDYEAAQHLVADLVEEARNGHLETAHFIDHHLAEMLAQGWPRSAALVEAPAEEFHWLDEAGSLDERPALRFLNDRIKGMKFHAKVQVEGHALHKAWVELSREGEDITWANRRAVNGEDIRTLLDGLRQRFPEVESYLNPLRVGAWERRLGMGAPVAYRPPPGQQVKGWLTTVGIVVGGLLIIGFIGSLQRAPDDGGRIAPPPDMAMTGELPAEAFIRLVVGGDTAARLDQGGGGFATMLNDVIRYSRESRQSDEFVLRASKRFARRFALETRRAAGFAELVAINEAYRMWLQTLQEQGALGAECPLMMGEAGSGTDIDLTPEQVAREQALYAQLLDARLLYELPTGGPMRASVPGSLLDAISTATGLDRATITAALSDQAHPQRCRVSLAALNVVLERPADYPIDLLRML